MYSLNDIRVVVGSTPQEFADFLEKIPEQGGYTGQDIIKYLRKGDLTRAQYLHRIDSDKLRCFPEFQLGLFTTLGCAMHGDVECSDKMCADAAEYALQRAWKDRACIMRDR